MYKVGDIIEFYSDSHIKYEGVIKTIYPDSYYVITKKCTFYKVNKTDKTIKFLSHTNDIKNYIR